METTGTVADLAARRPLSVAVLQRHGIDFCCGGQRPLEAACATAGIDTTALLAEVEQAEDTGDAGIRWDEAPLPTLIDHLIERHNRPLDAELPRIEAMARRVLKVHGPRDPERFEKLLELVLALRAELEPHMVKEEAVLFPWILRGNGRDAGAPVRVMLMEHEAVGALLQGLRDTTDDFVVPLVACATWRALWQGLEALEADLHQHIHLENNILFPRALREA
jgi:regulator of cell morphogenesis and NO signaling